MRAPSGSSPLGRYRARVPLPYVHAHQSSGPNGQRGMLEDLERRARTNGASEVLLVTQDPTDPTLVDLLARGRVRSDQVLNVVGAEPVEEPPVWSFVSLRTPPIALEPGMLDDEAKAVGVALRFERSPRHLEGFAHTLDPYFPCAASTLRQRIAVLEPGAGIKPDIGPAPSPDEARKARTALPSLGLPPELTNLEIKRAASCLAQGERLNDVPMGILHIAAKTLRRTHTRLAEDGESREAVYVVDPAAMLAACPPTGEEAYVSATAAKLALAQTKPKISGVARFERARSLMSELQTGNVPPEDRMQLLLARAMLEKARSCIERRRWVEWYRKQV